MSTVSFQMNRLMKLLAVVTALGLIPATIGGLLGMNVLGAPWPFTLPQVIFIVVLTVVITLYILRAERHARLNDGEDGRLKLTGDPRPGRDARMIGTSAQNGFSMPNQNCGGVSALTVLATSKRTIMRSTRLKRAISTRRPAPTECAMPPTEWPWE